MVQVLIARRETRKKSMWMIYNDRGERALSEKEERSSSHKREPKLDATRVKRCFNPEERGIDVVIL